MVVTCGLLASGRLKMYFLAISCIEFGMNTKRASVKIAAD